MILFKAKNENMVFVTVTLLIIKTLFRYKLAQVLVTDVAKIQGIKLCFTCERVI